MSSFPMVDPVQAMLAQTSLQNTLFAANSRYYKLGTRTIELTRGKPIVYLERRFLPPVSSFQVLQTHTVMQGERLDNIAAQFFSDATLFWRLCDANEAMRPEALTEEPGTTLNITMPQGVTGAPL